MSGLMAFAVLIGSPDPEVRAGPPSPPTTGTIRGRLVWAAGPIPIPKIEAPATPGDASCRSKPTRSRDLAIDPASRGVANGIAYLVDPTGDYQATGSGLLRTSPDVVVATANCEFIPPVVVVHPGQKLTFLSSDPVEHVVSISRDAHIAKMSVPRILPNGRWSYRSGNEGWDRRPTPISCDIHPGMKGHVFFAGHPFAVVTGEDGSFEMAGVPAGEQHLILWHSVKGYVTGGGGVAVDVRSGGVSDMGEVKILK